MRAVRTRSLRNGFHALFGRDPRTAKRDNVDASARSIAARERTVQHAPLLIYLELASVCNLRCVMCAVTWDPHRRSGAARAGFMDVSVIDRLTPVLPRVARCVVNGTGEPMMHPQFFAIVERLKAHRCWVGFNTNATFLDEAAARALIIHEVDHVTVSMDGASPEVFEAIRHGARFEAVRASVARFTALRREARSRLPFVGLEMVLMRDNVHEMAAMVRLARDLGVDGVHFEPLYDHGEDSAYSPVYTEHALSALPPGRLEESLAAAQAEAARLGIHAECRLFPAAAPVSGASTAPRPADRRPVCGEPWTTLFVDWRGSVRPCCFSPVVLGDLGAQDWNAIWNGEPVQGLRDTLGRGRPNDSCAQCIGNGTPRHIVADVRGQLA
jgi:MoaA/NifB/PqqE/SkfB family radical SAM enzyme